jgi:biopolymer transport protein ExbD
MAGGGGGGEGEPEFQIAPMIDVLLVLLIFFMTITSAEVLKVDKKLTLPVSPNAKKRDPEYSKHEMAVNLRWNEGERKAALVVDEKIYDDQQELVPYLQERYEADKKLRVVIRGDKGLPAIEVQRLMNVLAEAGLSDISFAASNK